MEKGKQTSLTNEAGWVSRHKPFLQWALPSSSVCWAGAVRGRIWRQPSPPPVFPSQRGADTDAAVTVLPPLFLSVLPYIFLCIYLPEPSKQLLLLFSNNKRLRRYQVLETAFQSWRGIVIRQLQIKLLQQRSPWWYSIYLPFLYWQPWGQHRVGSQLRGAAALWLCCLRCLHLSVLNTSATLVHSHHHKILKVSHPHCQSRCISHFFGKGGPACKPWLRVISASLPGASFLYGAQGDVEAKSLPVEMK